MPEWLKRDVGPFPVGVWLIIIAAGLGIGYVVNRQLGAEPEPEPELVPDDVGPDPYSGGFGAGAPGNLGPVNLGGSATQPAPPTDGSGGTEIFDNDTWLSVAARGLAERHEEWRPLAIFDALQLYLSGQKLTSAQRAIVNEALGTYGPPPLGAPLVPDTVPTAPAPGGSGGGGSGSGGGSGAGSGSAGSTSASREQQLVTEVYQEVLGRRPDSGGLAYWTRQVEGGMTRSQLRTQLRRSDEYGRLVIRKAYRDIVGRPPGSSGLSYWLGVWRDASPSEAQIRRWITDAHRQNQ